jgi:uncharacterized protein YndB with AHSA1/START domain
MTDPSADPSADPHALRLHRELAAPLNLVWAAMTDPAHLARWWGPSGFTTVTQAHDLRVGGAWRMTMHGPDGRVYPNHAVFDVIEAPHRLVLRYVDETGENPNLHVTTLTLTALSPASTRIDLVVTFPSAVARADTVDRYGAVQGGRQTLARLAAFVEGAPAAEREPFVLRRVFAARPELVWAAWTRADHLQRWFHPDVWTVTRCELDLTVGGVYFYSFSGPDFPEAHGLWRFTEIDPPRRLAFLSSFADAAGQPTDAPFPGAWPRFQATTVTFEHHAGIGGGTLLTLRSTPVDASEAEHAAFEAMKPSMQGGWGQTLDSLVTFLAAE